MNASYFQGVFLSKLIFCFCIKKNTSCILVNPIASVKREIFTSHCQMEKGEDRKV